MKRNALWMLISVVLIGTFALAACKPAATPTEEVVPTQVPTAPAVEVPTEVPTEVPLMGHVTLWQAWKESEIASLNEVIAAFQALYPEVTIDVLYTPFDDLRGRFETAAATGEGPTVLIGAADWGPAFYDAGLVADISSMAGRELLDTINPAALGAVQYRGALIGFPETIKGVLLFRNSLIIPEPASTWEEFVAAAQAATQGDVIGADLEYGFFFSSAHLMGLGGQLMDPITGLPAFNNATGIEWVNLLNSFKDVGPTEYYTDNDVNLFKAGVAGYIIDGSWNASALAEAIGADNLAVDPWPTYGDGHLAGYVQTENIYLSANATGDDLAASFAFMEFFMSPEAQGLLAEPTKAGHIPAVTGVDVTDRIQQEMIEAFLQGAIFPVVPEMGAYWGPMDTALKSVFDEGADPATTLQTAFDQITGAVNQMHGQ